MLSLNKYLTTSKLALACSLLFNNILQSQNLLSNGSFENYSNISCSDGGFDNNSIFPAPHVVTNWYNFNSPDYFNSACAAGGYSVPQSWFGNCYAKQGNAFTGIGVYDIRSSYQEYIYQQLPTPLQAGTTYCLSFYLSRADRFPFAIKKIGAYFSSSLPSMVSSEYINTIPQIENQNGFLIDTTQWVQVQGCFLAQGGEQYITIGNFNSNANTDTLRILSSNPLTGTGTDVAYYYIDDVYLYDALTTGINEQGKENDIEVYPNPNNGFFEINNLPEEKCVLRITNALGQLVYTTVLQQSKNMINLSEEKEGIYFYHILINDKITKTDKIVIIK